MLHGRKKRSPAENESVEERLTGDVALHSCPYCTESCSDVKQLEDHIKIHTENQQETSSRPADAVLNTSSTIHYQCFDCPLIVESSADLLKHAQLHTGIRLYGCTDCGERFTELSQHSLHWKSHDENEKFYCDVCTNWYETKLVLDYHQCRKGQVYPPAGFKFHCCKCTRNFPSRYALLSHFLTHTPVRSYACTLCGVGYRNLSKLFHHVDNNHKNTSRSALDPSIYQCLDCPLSFECCADLMDHAQVHTGIKPYQCTDCAQTFADFQHYDRHHKSHDKNEKFYCDQCTNVYETKVMLENHRCKKGEVYTLAIVRGNYSRYKCCNCSKDFPSRFAMLDHFISHTSVRTGRFICTICGMGFKGTVDLSKHVRCHNSRKEKQLPYLLRKLHDENDKLKNMGEASTEIGTTTLQEDKDALINELRSSDIPQVPRHAAGLKPHECTVCVEGFTSEHLMIQHLQTVPVEAHTSCVKGFDEVNNLIHHINSNTPRELLHETMNPNSFFGHREETDVMPSTSQATASPQIPQPTSISACKLQPVGYAKFPCAKVSKRKLADRHSVHYQCFNCPLSFECWSDFMDHAQVHTGIKPYCCTDCGEKFTDITHYIQHYKSHDRNEKFYCDVCTNWYETKVMLDYHQCRIGKVHPSVTSGDPSLRRVVCCNCTLDYPSTLKMLTHFVLFHTALRPYVCTLCGQGFARRGRLPKHVDFHMRNA